MDPTALASLDREPYINLATFRRSGVAVETPGWFARDGDRLFVFSEARSGKMKRLRNDPRVRLAPCSVRGRVHGGWLQGVEHRALDPEVIERAYDALRGKYGWKMLLTDAFSALSGRIHRRAILEIELREEGATAPS